MLIGNRPVGPDHPPLVIAEIGINHEGSLETAFEMVDAAFAAGAEVVKHQTHVVEDEMSSEARGVVPGNADVSIYEIMARAALSEVDERRLKERVESHGMIFISTPFSRAAADRLESMNVAAYKIGSGECNNYPLIRHIAAFGKPMIVSTGMNTIDSVAKTVAILEESGVDYALLHTTNVYPTSPDLVRLNAMVELGRAFPKAVIGLSDHTVTNHACFGAVALGASILERHFTDRVDRPGPDISCSMDPHALRDLIHGSEIIFRARGGSKGAVPEEEVTIRFAFASVVSVRPIRQGEELTRENIWVKRPGTGAFPAEQYEKLLGMRAASDIPADVQLRHEHVGSVADALSGL